MITKNEVITMMTSSGLNKVAGRVVLEGQQGVVASFNMQDGASASEKENELVAQAYVTKRKSDGQKPVAVTLKSINEQESKLMDWVDFEGEGNE